MKLLGVDCGPARPPSQPITSEQYSKLEKDLTEIPKNIKQKLEIIPVQWIDEVLQVALVRMPEPLSDSEVVDTIAAKRKKSASKGKPAQAH